MTSPRDAKHRNEWPVDPEPPGCLAVLFVVALGVIFAYGAWAVSDILLTPLY